MKNTTPSTNGHISHENVVPSSCPPLSAFVADYLGDKIGQIREGGHSPFTCDNCNARIDEVMAAAQSEQKYLDEQIAREERLNEFSRRR